MASRLTWSREPHEKGLASVGAGPRGRIGKYGGDEVIHVNAAGGSWQGPLRGWYWVSYLSAHPRNTYGEGDLFPTWEAAQADATAWFKSLPRIAE